MADAPANHPIRFEFDHDGVDVAPQPAVAYQVIDKTSGPDPAGWGIVTEGTEATNTGGTVRLVVTAGLPDGTYQLASRARGPLAGDPNADNVKDSPAVPVVIINNPTAPTVVQVVILPKG